MKIGLMYVSDYGYGANPEKWRLSMVSSSSDYGTDNWLFLGDEWTISRYTGYTSDAAGRAFLVISFNGGSVGDSRVYGSRAIRPSFYLAPTVEFSSGTGTSTDPFVLQTGV